MRLNIKNRETDKLARLLAKETGETITFAVTEALRYRLDSIRQAKAAESTHPKTRKRGIKLH
jgi:antitoxin VapB